MSDFKNLRVELTASVWRFSAAMRGASRAIRQTDRNYRTGPISDERRQIIELGRREMAAACEWFDTTHRRTP